MNQRTAVGMFFVAVILAIGVLVARQDGHTSWPGRGETGAREAEYIKDVVALREGIDGVQVYLTVADARGELTKTSGRLTLKISETRYEPSGYERHVILYEYSRWITPSMFTPAKVGQGAFQRDSLILHMGRITYSQFVERPRGQYGRVHATIVLPGGKTLEGRDSVFWGG